MIPVANGGGGHFVELVMVRELVRTPRLKKTHLLCTATFKESSSGLFHFPVSEPRLVFAP